jgi:hypothetical protein
MSCYYFVKISIMFVVFHFLYVHLPWGLRGVAASLQITSSAKGFESIFC